MRVILRSLASSRQLQITFANLIGATRLKEITNNKLISKNCPNCKARVDTWAHHLECYRFTTPIYQLDEEKWLEEKEEYLKAIHIDATPTDSGKKKPGIVTRREDANKRTQRKQAANQMPKKKEARPE